MWMRLCFFFAQVLPLIDCEDFVSDCVFCATGADVTATNNEEWNAIHIAASAGHHRVIVAVAKQIPPAVVC